MGGSNNYSRAIIALRLDLMKNALEFTATSRSPPSPYCDARASGALLHRIFWELRSVL
jgi:hypothetical protein